jgi:hypothetical protein
LPDQLAIALARFGQGEIPRRADAHPALDAVDLIASDPAGVGRTFDLKPQPAAVVVHAGLARPD